MLDRAEQRSGRIATATWRSLVSIFAFMGVISMPLLAATHDLPTELKAPPAATAELDTAHRAAQCSALETTARAYLKKGWRIEEARCFLVPAAVTWNSVEKFVESELAYRSGSRQAFDWHDPGHDLVAVWKVGRFGGEYIATAMSREPVDGQHLVAYYSLRQEK
jgi:hypothetical protein